MANTSVPAAILNFVSMATAAVTQYTGDVPGSVEVQQGPIRLGDPAIYFTVTGWNPDRAPRSIGTGASAGFFLLYERYEILGQVFAWSGGNDWTVTNSSALGVFELVEGAVRLNPSLSGAVLFSYFSAAPGEMGISENQAGGAVTTINYELHCEAQI